MNTEEIPRISTGLEFLCIVLSTNVPDLYRIVPELMPILFQIFTGDVNNIIVAFTINILLATRKVKREAAYGSISRC